MKGVQGVVKQFEKTLADMGVERIKTVGEPFDPHLHEAVGIEEGDSGQEIVSEELQPGYKLGDEVIRHAMVKVKVKNGIRHPQEADRFDYRRSFPNPFAQDDL